MTQITIHTGSHYVVRDTPNSPSTMVQSGKWVILYGQDGSHPDHVTVRLCSQRLAYILLGPGHTIRPRSHKLETNSHNVTKLTGQLRSQNTACVTLHGLGHTTLLGLHYTAQVQLHGLGHTAWLGSLVWVLVSKYTTPPSQVTQNSLGHSVWLMHTTQSRPLWMAWVTVWCSTVVRPE